VKRTKFKATPAALEASRRRWQDGLTFKVLMRARAAVVAGEPIAKEDREWVAIKLEQAAHEDLARIKGMTPSFIKAHVADYIARDLGVTLKQAVEFVAADGDASVEAIIGRVKSLRSYGWRKQGKRSKKGRA
jgi:acyl-coenzyme A synthetase/AMP-(fatty) acid ligase